jgi:hypothetical protein
MGWLLCRWTGCRALRDGGTAWCSQHRLLAAQHATSHRLDGHSRVPIVDCPTCADPDGWKPSGPAAPPSRSEQCPRRGAGLSHTQDARFAPDGSCVHCGLLVVP